MTSTAVSIGVTKRGKLLRTLYTAAPAVIGIGRKVDCELQLDDEAVSRKHGRLVLGTSGFVLEDASINGTRVYPDDVIRRRHVELPYGATLGVGPFDVMVSREELELPEPPAPVVTIDRRALYASLASLRRRIHHELLRNLDMTRIDPANADEPTLRPRVVTALRRLVGIHRAELPPSVAPEDLIGELVDEVLGLGPLEPLLQDPAVSEIMVIDPLTIYVEKDGRLELTDARFTDDERVRCVIERIVTPLGRRIDESQPLVDARLKDGSRVNAVIRPLALRGTCITIRKFPAKRLRLADLLTKHAIDPRMARFLTRSVAARKNILISGGTGSGKTTLLNILSASIPAGERIITIEDAAELQLDQPHVVSLETKVANMEGKGAFAIRELVKNALRMRPDRIVVGECRGGEALDMLQAMNTGHEGSLTTIHANGPAEALARLETLSLMAGLDLPARAIREQIARSIHLVVQQTRLADGTRKVTTIAEVIGLGDDGRIELRRLFEYERTGTGPRGEILGAFEATGYLPSFLEELSVRGLVAPGEPCF